MFTIAQFFEKQQLRVLAVPASWIRDGFLMWPKLSSNEKLDKLRTEGREFLGATRKIPVISSRKYKSLEAAEAAADDLLRQDVSDIEAKRKLLKHRKVNPIKPKPLQDYNKIIKDISSSKAATHFGSNCFSETRNDRAAGPSGGQQQVHLRNLPESNDKNMVHRTVKGPLVESLHKECNSSQIIASHPTEAFGNQVEVLSSPHIGYIPHTNLNHTTYQSQPFQSINEEGSSSIAMVQLSQVKQQPLMVASDNILYINSSTDQHNEVSGNIVDMLSEIKAAISTIKTDISSLGSIVSSLQTDVKGIYSEVVQMQQEIVKSVDKTVRQAVEESLGENFPRFLAMLDTNRNDQSTSQEGHQVENHKLVNDEDDLSEFNRMLGSKELFDDYVKYFTKIIPPATYSEKGDAACYIIVDCLFTRTFWNQYTWTGINRGNKSKRGFREFINVRNLLLAIVSVGDPTYTSNKLELFCKNKLFRYSKARSSNKKLRKSTCRIRVKKNAADNFTGDLPEDPTDHLRDDPEEDQADYSSELDYVDDPDDNITTDSNHDYSDPEPGAN